MTHARHDGRLVTFVLVLLGFGNAALAALMVMAPGTFFNEIGRYGLRNDHYIRDVATFQAAFALVLLIAAARPSWRIPVLVLARSNAQKLWMRE